MRIHGEPYRTIWHNGTCIEIIDQRRLPFEFVIEQVMSVDKMVEVIAQMYVRGAPLIGVAGAFGAALAAEELMLRQGNIDDQSLRVFDEMLERLNNSRPTAVNLSWGLKKQRECISGHTDWHDAAAALRENAIRMADEDVACSESMGEHGRNLIEQIAAKRDGPVNILTHCNAGWLATIDFGTATAPIYKAKAAGIDIHVWVDETRPRLQGAKLTAFELKEEEIPHTIIADNAAGHLMQHGKVDICIVGTDRTTRAADVANKIGTYSKALAAKDNDIPFYVAAPSSSIDWSIRDGIREIPIEQRSTDEVLKVDGCLSDGTVVKDVRIASPGSEASNFAFDVTPARLVTGLITERGVAAASEADLLELFPEHT